MKCLLRNYYAIQYNVSEIHTIFSYWYSLHFFMFLQLFHYPHNSFNFKNIKTVLSVFLSWLQTYLSRKTFYAVFVIFFFTLYSCFCWFDAIFIYSNEEGKSCKIVKYLIIKNINFFTTLCNKNENQKQKYCHLTNRKKK